MAVNNHRGTVRKRIPTARKRDDQYEMRMEKCVGNGGIKKKERCVQS